MRAAEGARAARSVGARDAGVAERVDNPYTARAAEGARAARSVGAHNAGVAERVDYVLLVVAHPLAALDVDLCAAGDGLD